MVVCRVLSGYTVDILKKGCSAVLDLKSTPLFRDLSEEEHLKIQTCLREKNYIKGELLFMEGRSCERIFIVRSGRVKVFRTTSAGREQILESLNPGDTCACNPGTREWCCTSSAQALADTTVWYLSREDYVRMVESNSKLARALNHLFSERLQNLNRLVEQVSLMDTKARLIKFLLDLQADGVTKRNKSDNVLFIPFTREEIAQRLGMARETVARQLSQLKDARLIDLKPKQIVILDKQGLEKLLA